MLVKLTKSDQVGQYLPLCCANHPETVVKVKSPDEFGTVAPEGGCQLACQFRLKCSHVCARKCHTLDLDHVKYKSRKPCAKMS